MFRKPLLGIDFGKPPARNRPADSSRTGDKNRQSFRRTPPGNRDHRIGQQRGPASVEAR
jgi:hypothetical protein